MSQSLQGAGGIGGLLTQVDIGAVKSYAYLYDGNGNVSQLIDNSDGSIDAHYEYDPYGGSILASGTATSGNPYRFSTKYYDAEYDQYYYGYRIYLPFIGRWLNRDPIQELAAAELTIKTIYEPKSHRPPENIYGFALNRPNSTIDPLGLLSIFEIPKPTIPVVGGGPTVGAGPALLPIIVTAETVYVIQELPKLWRLFDKVRRRKLYITYKVLDACKVVRYVGRTSSGTPPNDFQPIDYYEASEFNFAAEVRVGERISRHHAKLPTLREIKIDEWIYGGNTAYEAIRGREQQLLDRWGGSINDPSGAETEYNDATGTLTTPLLNRIRAVAKYNPDGRRYHDASNYFFGNLYEYTGEF